MLSSVGAGDAVGKLPGESLGALHKKTRVWGTRAHLEKLCPSFWEWGESLRPMGETYLSAEPFTEATVLGSRGGGQGETSGLTCS